MATKPERYKKLPPLKVKKVTSLSKGGGSREAKLTKMEVAEGNLASERLANRPTKDFSREELGSLMQVAPGGAEPHQIRTQSRQFRRNADSFPEVGAVDVVTARGTDRQKKKPMSAKTPKIDLED